MKKLLKGILCTALALTLTVGIGGCFVPVDENSVNLLAISASNVGVADCDYYVVAEPAATVKTGAIEGLKNVGSLQELYGNNGYPQAVIVAKKTVLQENYPAIREFLGAIIDNKAWLTDENTQMTDVINAVSSHLRNGTTPTFNANTLTPEVIANCGINFSYANDCKQALKDFIAKIKEVSENMAGDVSDDFFVDLRSNDYDVNVPTSKTYSVYMPDGAPALALAKLMHDNVAFGDCTFEYNVVPAANIQTYVNPQNPTADICVLPSNLASKLLGDGQTYKMLGTVTNGNLFLLSKNGTRINSVNISQLRGKTVGVVNLHAVPGLVFKIVLNDHNIKFNEILVGV